MKNHHFIHDSLVSTEQKSLQFVNSASTCQELASFLKNVNGRQISEQTETIYEHYKECNQCIIWSLTVIGLNIKFHHLT